MNLVGQEKLLAILNETPLEVKRILLGLVSHYRAQSIIISTK